MANQTHAITGQFTNDKQVCPCINICPPKVLLDYGKGILETKHNLYVSLETIKVNI